jgi:CheY-like chemotaxis protein
MVEADERRVKQIAFNLLSNAVKFTPDGGKVAVTATLVRAPDGYSGRDEVRVSVRDTGIGIAPEDQERIFQPFQQAGQPATMAREGTGLGLSLARRFVELHGGRIWLESQVGVGSTFTVALPITLASPVERQDAVALPPSAASPAARREQPPSGATAPKDPALEPDTRAAPVGTVLIVEDESRAAALLSVYLRGAGYHVVVAGDGDAGLELARRLRPTAIVLDLIMPGRRDWTGGTSSPTQRPTRRSPRSPSS